MSINKPHSHPANTISTSNQSQTITNAIRQQIHNNQGNNISLIPLTEIEKQKILARSDTTAKNILLSKPELTPTHQIRIDGIDFYFSPKINMENKQLFFVEKNGRIEPRVSRISGSGQKMHIFPGYDVSLKNGPLSIHNKRYSKGDMAWGLDYESGVIADSKLQKILTNIPSSTAYISRF